MAAEIKSAKADMVTVITAKGAELTLKKDLLQVRILPIVLYFCTISAQSNELQEMNPPKFTKTEDMSNLSFLNDASVLWNLRDRYASMLIYVSSTTCSSIFSIFCNQ